MLDGRLDAAELEGNMTDLARLNRWLGGSELSWRALQLVLSGRGPSKKVVRLLDVGTGAADIPVALLERARRNGLQLEVLATDVRPEILLSAKRRTTGIGGLTIGSNDRDVLSQADRSFDVVHCSLVLHHLEPAEAISLLAEMGRVAARAVIVNDLDRARRWWWAARLLTQVITRNRYTRHDAPLSVRRAYRPAEIRRLAAAANLLPVAELRSRIAYRYALIFEPGR